MHTSKSIALVTAAGLLGVPLALAPPTQAVVPTASNTIHACQKKKSGQLRVVKKGKKCKKSEKKVSWSTGGPQGSPGSKGDNGSNGAPGAPGPGATPFSVSLTTTNALGSTTSEVIPVGDLTITIQCDVELGVSGSFARVTSPTAGSYQSRGSWLNNPNNEDGGFNSAPYRDSRDGSFDANKIATMSQRTVQARVPDVLRNFGVMNYTVSNGAGTYLITYSATTVQTKNPPSSTPKAYCDLTGWWAKLA